MQRLPGQIVDVEAGDEFVQQRSSLGRGRDRRERVEPTVRGLRGPEQGGACQIHFHGAASERPVQQRLLEHDALEPRHPAADIHARQQTAVHPQAVAGAAKREVMQREERERDGQQADEDHDPEQQHQQHAEDRARVDARRGVGAVFHELLEVDRQQIEQLTVLADDAEHQGDHHKAAVRDDAVQDQFVGRYAQQLLGRRCSG